MRKAVNIWLERVIGGRGHFGVDLILKDGTKLAYREQRNFGTPADDATFANGILFTDVNASGVNDGASTKLSWASIEIYSHWNPALGQEDRKYMDLQIVVDSFNYHSGDTDYSSHIGWVMLPEVNWNPTARNYARIVGHVKKNGQSCSDPVAIDFRQAAPWKKWFSFYPHDPNVHWPLRCVSYTGNLAVYHPVHNPNPTHEGWFDSGPLLPDDYQVTITHTDPQLGERPPVIAKLGVLTHDANTVIDVGKPNFGLPH